MRDSRPFFRMAPAAIVMAVLISPCTQGAPVLDAATSAPKKSPSLPPDIETKLKELFDKAKAEQIKSWDPRIKKEIDDITTVTGLSDDGKKSLELAANQAVATWADGWSANFNQLIRKQLADNPEIASRMITQMSQVVSFSQIGWNWSADTTPPFEQEGWTKALQKTLTPEQLATWNKTQGDRKEAIAKEISEPLKQGAERIRTQQMQAISAEYKEIELAVGMPQDRADKLEALAKSVVDGTTEAWRKRIENTALAMDEEQRRQFAAGRVFFGPDDKEIPTQVAAWKDGVAALLTPDEVKRLAASREVRKSKRAHVMGEVMIMLLDDKIAFTSTQRQQLQSITDRLVKDIPELYPETGLGTYITFSPTLFYAASGKATDAELRPILDETQRKHWRQLSKDEPKVPNGDEDGSDGDDENPPEKKQAKAPVYTEPEDVEKCISSFLYDKAKIEKKRVLETNVLKAEDLSRAAGLSPETTARLLIAARGATEEYLTNWKWNIDQQIRSQLQEATPENVKQRLEGLENYFFQRNMDMGNRQGAWEKTVQAELNPKQLDSWHKETDARKVFREQAIADLVLAEFDRKNQLTDDQWKKLGPAVVTALHDYNQDISRIFAFSNNTPWYLGSVYTLMPLAGIPDADLKAILTPDQWDRWLKSNEYTNAMNLWQNVQQFHKQRQPPDKQ